MLKCAVVFILIFINAGDPGETSSGTAEISVNIPFMTSVELKGSINYMAPNFKGDFIIERRIFENGEVRMYLAQ